MPGAPRGYPKTIFEHDATGIGANAYMSLADEFLSRHAAVGPVLA